MMHTLVKASLQADSRIDMVWKFYENQCEIMPKWLPFRALVRPGVLQGLEDHPKAPKSTLKGSPRRPKGALWEPQGRPKSDQESPKSAQREPKSAPGRPRKRQIEKKSVTEAKKVDFRKCAPRLGPANARSTLDPLKSSQNRAGIVQSPFFSGLGDPFLSLWSLESGLDALGGRFGSTQNS